MKQSTEQAYLGRGLHSDKWKDALKGNGKLKELIEEVRKDKDLVLQIREDYFNVYYKGGNLVKVTSENSFQFDYNYYKCEPKYDTPNKRQEKHREVLECLKDTRDYLTFIATMKDLMEKFWDWLERDLHEKDTQHQLCGRLDQW